MRQRRSIRIFLKYFFKKNSSNLLLGLLFILLLTVIVYKHNSIYIESTEYQALVNNLVRFKTNNLSGIVNKLTRARKDWHNYQLYAEEDKRDGIGEHGVGYQLEDAENDELRDKLFSENGYNGFLSDMISVNRSVADIRHKDCWNKTYAAELPSVSVIIPFFDEHLSTLMRTVHGVINQSPEHLIVEVILVDDGSEKPLLQAPLEDYIHEHLPKAKIIRQPERLGLIRARQEGARIAIGEVLIFLDAHTEPNRNWLPPLLDPIAANYKTCVCPFIDVIDAHTFQYRAQDEGGRGAFDWQFNYKRLPLLPKSKKHPSDLFESPVMAGGLFAISAEFFWQLGGYDEGLDIWGGEQYELSFKIWQCGGQMYDAPCSRVGHIYRHSPYVQKKSNRKTDILARNLKRVAEVWMDEYKEFIYARSKKRYEECDVGDISSQLAIREKLKCKPFKWFMENVAFDLTKRYPPIEPIPYAYGIIQSVSNPKLCLDTLGHTNNQDIGMYSCSSNRVEPQYNQYFMLRKFRDIALKTNLCLDVVTHTPNATVSLFHCHHMKGNQYWKYDIENKWLLQGIQGTRCLDYDRKSEKVFVNICDKSNENMKWEWGYLNETAIATWDKDNDVSIEEYNEDEEK